MVNKLKDRYANTVVVLDFETTGLSPNMGERGIEIGAVLIENGNITDTFQKLMNPNRRIDAFIENYTGITNDMVKTAEPCAVVMQEFAEFINGHNLVAHNASFDKKFLDAEFDFANVQYKGSFACSMLLARRLYPLSNNHKLGTLVDYKQLPTDGVFHRALADAQMTAHLWLAMLDDLNNDYSLGDVPFSFMKTLSRVKASEVPKYLQK
ncbi:DNA polymerase III subunit epsilon [Shewanella sp. OPT22]|nr:DNA polymerase III subunit epsilon [Shewanella sp. OPT22]